MKNTDLAQRLIEDIDKSMEIRKRVASPTIQIMSISLNPIDLLSATNVLLFDDHLEKAISLINHFGIVINHEKGQPLDIYAIRNGIAMKYAEVTKAIQKLIDSSMIAPLEYNRHISEFLFDELETVHKYAC